MESASSRMSAWSSEENSMARTAAKEAGTRMAIYTYPKAKSRFCRSQSESDNQVAFSFLVFFLVHT